MIPMFSQPPFHLPGKMLSKYKRTLTPKYDGVPFVETMYYASGVARSLSVGEETATQQRWGGGEKHYIFSQMFSNIAVCNI